MRGAHVHHCRKRDRNVPLTWRILSRVRWGKFALTQQRQCNAMLPKTRVCGDGLHGPSHDKHAVISPLFFTTAMRLCGFTAVSVAHATVSQPSFSAHTITHPISTPPFVSIYIENNKLRAYTEQQYGNQHFHKFDFDISIPGDLQSVDISIEKQKQHCIAVCFYRFSVFFGSVRHKN